jgi:hypothetical protein
MSRLLDALSPVAREARRLNPPLTLNVEMQPGPLYLLGDLKSIGEYCNHLDSLLLNSDENKVSLVQIGAINLDVPHYALLGCKDLNAETPQPITVQDLWARPEVLRRIAGAHLSDHGRGHFSDNIPGSHSPDVKGTFAPWISLLNDHARSEQHPDLPFKYRGFVSLEFEAAKNPKMVNQGVSNCKVLGFRMPPTDPGTVAACGVPPKV